MSSNFEPKVRVFIANGKVKAVAVLQTYKPRGYAKKLAHRWRLIRDFEIVETSS